MDGRARRRHADGITTEGGCAVARRRRSPAWPVLQQVQLGEQPAGERRAADESGGHSPGERQLRSVPHALSAAQDLGHLAQQLGRAHGWIGLREAVPLSYETGAGSRNHTVCEQPAMAGEQDNVARDGIFDTAMPDMQDIARPNRRKHAGPGDTKAQCAKGTDGLRGQLDLRQISGIDRDLHGLAAN